MSEKVYTTWTKDTVIQVLKEDYNSAVKFFNEHDYKTFWGKIRLVLESFGRLTIFELNSKEFAEKIINQSGYSGQGTNLFHYIINNQNNIERDFKNFFHDFADFYKFASQYGSHPSYEKDVKKVYVCACLVSMFVELVFQKSLFAKETTDVLNRLDKFDIDRRQFIASEREKLFKENSVIKKENLNLKDQIKVETELRKKAENQNIELLNQKHNTEKKLETAESQKADAEKKKKEALAQKNEAEKQLKEISEKLENTKTDNQVAEKRLKSKISEQEKQISQQDNSIEELNGQISELNYSLSEKDLIINSNNEQIGLLNDKINQLQQQLDEINSKSAEPQSDISDDIEKQAEFIHLMSKRLSDVLRPQTVIWMVEEGSLDDDQLDIIERTNDKNMLVTGCAGSGKSVIAMYKAEQLSKAGYSVILIAYTKSLSAFMREGVDVKSLPYSFYYHHQWQKKRPKADYIIVDEIQDFTAEEIKEFMNAAKKHYFFFGDWAQTIYQGLKTTISKEGLCNLTGLKPLELYTNYRLPRNIAKITQEYVGVGVNEYSEKIYKNEEKSLPHIVRFTNKDEQISAIVKIIEENSDKKIGILLPTNPDIKLLSDKLRSLGVKFELKINEKDEEDDESFESLSNLDFNSSLPKLLTYHSAKGLQFDVVILPFCEDANDRMSLYVAMTRTLQSLYVLYSSDLKQPLSNVPESLYLNKL